MSDSGIQRQRTIFIDGIAGNKPAVPIDYDKLEKEASRKMSKEAFAYIAGGAGLESTISENRRGVDRWKICPRMLKDVGVRGTQRTIFRGRFIQRKMGSSSFLASTNAANLL